MRVEWMVGIAWIHILFLDYQRENEGDSSVVRFCGIDFRISGSWRFRRVCIATREFLINSYLDPRYSVRVEMANPDPDTGPN
jgi:hypothetical protein